MPLRLVFIDDLGREWLVRDGVVQEKKFTPLTLGDQSARFRVWNGNMPRLALEEREHTRVYIIC